MHYIADHIYSNADACAPILFKLVTHQVIFFIVIAHKVILVRHVGFSYLTRLRLRNPRSGFRDVTTNSPQDGG